VVHGGGPGGGRALTDEGGGEAGWIARSRTQAEEWALVLTAADIPHRIESAAGGGFALRVPWSDRERAARELEAFGLETAAAADADVALPRHRARGAGFLVAALLLAFHAVTGPRDEAVAWFRSGSASAERILAGEYWRAVTALTLHADAGHALANAASSAVFLTALSGVVGAGVALWLALGAGIAGNLATAVAYGMHHSAVGASTALFGAVGALAGCQFARLRQRRRRRRWLPIAAGLALLAMLGTAPGADIAAHLFGCLSGIVLGLGAALAGARPRGAGTQAALALAAGTVIVACWVAALR
jgi:membrane associated rhomboid family serine protease